MTLRDADKPTYPKCIPLSKLIIYGTCKECGGYLVNTVDELSASLGCLNIGCLNCGQPDMKLEEKIRETHHKNNEKTWILTFGDAYEIFKIEEESNDHDA